MSQLDPASLEDLLSVAHQVSFGAGTTVWRIGDPVEAAFVILSGHVSLEDEAGTVVEAGAGDSLDLHLVVSGGRRDTTALALEPVELIRLPAGATHGVAERRPGLMEALSNAVNGELRSRELRAALQRLFGTLDDDAEDDLASRVQWVELEPGDVLFRQGDPGDALYVLVDGTLSAWTATHGSELLLNEIAPGETIGEVAIMTGAAARSATVKAVKPSLLVRVGREDFEATAAEHPIVYKALAGVLTDYLIRSRPGQGGMGGAREITLVPHDSEDGLLDDVAQRIAAALNTIGPTLHLSVSRLREMDHMFPFEVSDALRRPLHDPSNTSFSMWLSRQRKRFAFVLYQVEERASTWSRLCVDRADQIVVVARAASDPSPGAWERGLPSAGTIPRTLLLVHPKHTTPTGTHRWLTARRFAGHHHITIDRPEDFARFSRFLGGRATGLVLAGGGSRGFAHIGVIRAFHEAGIPIDSIGGTSSGGMCALTYAMDLDPAMLAERNQRDWVARRPWRRFGPPILSILNHRSWDHIMEEGYEGRNIEDLWIPAFCVSANIDAGHLVVHDRGEAWKAVRATSSLPAVLAPVLYGGEAHVDGGIMNNLPVDVMRNRTDGLVFAVSLGRRASERMPFETYPSPWRLAVDLLNPFKRSQPMHTLPRVMLQIAVLGDLAGSAARSGEADVVLEPPVHGYSMTDFSDVEGIIRMGYEYTADRLDALTRDASFAAGLRNAGIGIVGQPGTAPASR